MAKVVRLVKTIRTNWKKSICFTSVGLYGLNYAKGKYEDGLLRTAYCEEAKKYGDVTLKTGEKPKKVTVFLNPAVRNGKGKKLYDKNVAPVLNMAGLEVNVVRTEYEGQAKKFMTVLDATDAIVVAGGDGTLSEVLTGLLRREDKEEFANIPIGFIPLGYTNTLSKSLLPGKLSDVAAMLEASFSVVRGTTRPTDILCVKGEEDKTVYTATGLHWGAFTDAASRKKK
ncbi:hypothetical protein CAPTEDRAFT_217000 [Capitella teleta]|uniref:DAGKc domain-containing protein n=1 Tax=Capitella teleta TaxID=283909 RepID=R7TMD4_CAPTE|nr:hypothetical protein CAPTEDRAFT_217000 [Capitella teleta]|eukprot:ELT95013.1 hypothetical protein CAPTEDRAFT_217000 [Capitella teleta]